MRDLTIGLLATAIAAVGCLTVDLADSRFACEQGEACPDGFECCADERCAEDCEAAAGGACVADPSMPCCGADGAVISGCWPDAEVGLSWEDPPPADYLAHGDAETRCLELGLGGHDDWRLPSVDELRALIRSCPVTALGGVCPASDPGCLTSTADTCNPDACLGCSSAMNGGPGLEGCYWDGALAGSCEFAHWSRSDDPIAPTVFAWVVFFDRAMVTAMDKVTELNSRCVRGVFSP